MATEKQPTLDDLRAVAGPLWDSAKRLIETGINALHEAGFDVGALNDPAPAEPVDIATARDTVVTAALRYAAAEGDAGTSLVDTNAALEVLDDALAGYVDATGCREKPPTVTAVEALKPGNEVEFAVRGTVAEGYVNVPGDLGDSMHVEFVAEIGRDFRVLKTGEPA